MKQNNCLNSQKLRRIKNHASAALTLSTIMFLAAGCSPEAISQNSISSNKTKGIIVQEKKSSQEQGLSLDKNAVTTKAKASANIQSKNSKAEASSNIQSNNTKAQDKTTTDKKLEEITKQMDKIDASLKELDDSSDISNSETIINNIN